MASVAELARAHWVRGEPGRAVPEELVVVLYRMWVVALVFKTLGATWDMAWHFKWLRDDWAPPHVINTVGTVIVVGLVLYHTYTGIGVDRGTLRWMQWGTGIFLIAAPLDVINHRINGLDITAWSPSHAVLYIGTGAMIVGVIRGWTLHGQGDRYFFSIMCFLWFAVLDCFLFLNQHQEYGVLGLEAWERGTPYAEPSLLQFAADDLGRPLDRLAIEQFTLPMPDWVYPTWGTVTAMITLVLARRFVGRQWTATTVAAGYLAFRCAAWVLLAALDFPISTVPFYILGGAIAVDLSFRLRFSRYVQAWVGSVITACAAYLALLAQDAYLAAPPAAYYSVATAIVVLAMLWTALVYLTDSDHGRKTWRRIVALGPRLWRPVTGEPSRATPLAG